MLVFRTHTHITMLMLIVPSGPSQWLILLISLSLPWPLPLPTMLPAPPMAHGFNSSRGLLVASADVVVEPELRIISLSGICELRELTVSRARGGS